MVSRSGEDRGVGGLSHDIEQMLAGGFEPSGIFDDDGRRFADEIALTA